MIQNKQKFLIGLSIIILAILIFSVLINFNNQTTEVNQKFKFDSVEAALIDGISSAENKPITKEMLQEFIALSKEYNDGQYFVITIPYSEYGIDKHLAFVAAVKEKNGKFSFEKITPDISLNTEGNVKDVNYVPYATFYFDNINGLYFAIGKIFDESYKPYYSGNLIPLKSGAIYAIANEASRPLVFVSNE